MVSGFDSRSRGLVRTSRARHFTLAVPLTTLGWVVRKVDSAFQRIVWFVLSTLIHWIAIYPVDSVIQPSNNLGQVYKWVLVNLLVRVTLQWSSIPSRGEKKYSCSFHAIVTWISSGLIGYLARMHAYFASLCFALLCFALLWVALLCFVLRRVASRRVRRFAVLCCAVLCFALLCFALLCFALLCFALLCFALLCFALLCCALLCFALLCFALLCLALLCFALACNYGLSSNWWNRTWSTQRFFSR